MSNKKYLIYFDLLSIISLFPRLQFTTQARIVNKLFFNTRT